MLRSKDKTICDKEHTHNKFFSFLSQPCSNVSLPPPSSGILKDITPLYQEKPEYIILYKAPFYKKSLHTNPISLYDTI